MVLVMDKQQPHTDNMPSPSAQATEESHESPWKGSHKAGFLQIPNVLLKNQHQMGLAPTDLTVLLNIAMHWWASGRLPFPKTNTIAKRMGVDKRTVQRSIRNLSNLGLVERVIRKVDGGEVSAFDLSGLVKKLEIMASADAWYHHEKRDLAGTASTPEPGT